MQTIVMAGPGGREVEVPLALALDGEGRPVELVVDLEPAECDHAGQCWSGCFDLHCVRCGAQLFLPPRVLARLPGVQIEAMEKTWKDAGWPEWCGGWKAGAGWTVVAHPLYAHVGGIPVRNDRLAEFGAARAANG